MVSKPTSGYRTTDILVCVAYQTPCILCSLSRERGEDHMSHLVLIIVSASTNVTRSVKRGLIPFQLRIFGNKYLVIMTFEYGTTLKFGHSIPLSFVVT